jgi:hypothetical protein
MEYLVVMRVYDALVGGTTTSGGVSYGRRSGFKQEFGLLEPFFGGGEVGHDQLRFPRARTQSVFLCVCVWTKKQCPMQYARDDIQVN